ncbi:MAG: hydrogenase maturation nickel metallochaperone HypA [Bacteroidales bacterium]|nr:hydrogenase maturation nickel metallochaperone HypA [Bacteroidales bacterium]
MHELSLAMEVIELAQREAEKNGVSTIGEIRIEVGYLSGVEADAFKFALELLVKDTILEHAVIDLIRTPGEGRCSVCNMKFEMMNILDQCPGCRNFPTEITGGKEFRVLDLVAE